LVLVVKLVLVEILTEKTEIFQALMVWNPLAVEAVVVHYLMVHLVHQAEAVEAELRRLVVQVTLQALVQVKEILEELLLVVQVAEVAVAVVEQVQ
jgi:hypothetical protein